MSDITKINDHLAAGLARRLEQWKDKPNLQSAISGLITGAQELEDVFFELCNNRLDLINTIGEQLDQFGTIVGQSRLGLTDDLYRILLQARIFINISNGDANSIIGAAKLLTNARFIHYMNLNNAQFSIGSDGTIDVLSIDFLLSNLQRVAMGGVRSNYICIYDKTEAFSMDGNNLLTIGQGFGTINDINVGGKFGQCYNLKKKFSFSGNNTSDGGFGSIYDTLVGGVFE